MSGFWTYDIALRNITIYAQWFGVLTAFTFVLTRLVWLLFFGVFHKAFSVFRLLNMIFFPLLPLTVEMPHYFRSRWIFRTCVCYLFIPIVVNAIPDEDVSGIGVTKAAVSPVATMITCYGLFMPMILGKSLYLVHARGAFYFGYAAAITWVAREKRDDPTVGWVPTSHFEPAELLSVITACFYFLAQWIGHDYVFSRTFGGPGLELMNLVRTGRGPEYDSIGQDEGTIRLP